MGSCGSCDFCIREDGLRCAVLGTEVAADHCCDMYQSLLRLLDGDGDTDG